MAGAVTIVGRGPSWKQCEFRTTELWGNMTNLLVPELGEKPYTSVFAFDGLNLPGMEAALSIARERKIPVVSTLDYGDKLYPLRDVVKRFRTSYLKPTISYMLALALLCDYRQIRLDGIDQGPQWNYQDGKPYITFWLGMAQMAGVDLRIGQDSLRWQYRAGLSGLPQAFLENESDRIASHLIPRAAMV